MDGEIFEGRLFEILRESDNLFGDFFEGEGLNCEEKEGDSGF